MTRKRDQQPADDKSDSPEDAFPPGCTIKELPQDTQVAAAKTAIEFNPANAPAVSGLIESVMGASPTPQHLAFLTNKYWGNAGVDLSVSFMETTAPELRDRILSHMNAWGEFSNVRFRWSQSGGKVRISRGKGGYWSYLGTDALQIPIGQQTMNLEGFVMATPESEYLRVVRHETGHCLGAPHEHMRAQIIARIDPQKAIDYFRRTQGWDANTVRQQVLTPLEDSQLIGTPEADEVSIMTYQLPGSITRDGQPIPGGLNFSAADRAFAASVYPLAVTPAKPDPSGDLLFRVDPVRRVVTLPPNWTAVVSGS